MNTNTNARCARCLPLALAALVAASAHGSSHMDAPLITLDDAANTTDVYAFVGTRGGEKVLQAALGVYPFEEPGIGPNKYNFDDNVLYAIHVATGADVAAGRATLSYEFQFTTAYKTRATILQSYIGVVQDVDDAAQNLTQSYTVTRVDHASGQRTLLGTGKVPPNNQGIATPHYNVGSDGNQPALPGVASESSLDRYTSQAIASLGNGHRAFAGQREDGFYGDIQSIFDLLSLRSGQDRFDSQGGYNMHLIALEIPVSALGGDQQQVGIYATTSRRAITFLEDGGTSGDPARLGEWVQVGRQGNPLFCEALVAIQDKDLYNRSQPTSDAALFSKYAEKPELAALINAIVFGGNGPAPETARTDIVGIFIPDLIKVDLSTGPARLAGGGPDYTANPDDAGFSRLGIFGGDTLLSQISPGFGGGAVPGGWPNGRRFGDDVIDIAVTALISDLRTSPLTLRVADGIDNVSANDAVYHKVFPYASTPFNGRASAHNPQRSETSRPLINISTRGRVASGEGVLIGGFIISGTQPRRIIIRAQGPSLIPAGVQDPLLNPTLALYAGQNQIAGNDNWRSSQEADILSTGYAPGADEEAAIVATLSPGAYTAIVGGGTGTALIDVFLVD